MTLAESLTCFHRGDPPIQAPDPLLAERWLQTSAKGDSAKFTARLAWDGLTPDDVPLLASFHSADPIPNWVHLMESALTHLENGDSLPAAVKAPLAREREQVPYLEIWEAFSLAGSDRLPPSLRFPEVLWFLARRLSALAAPIFHEDFQNFLTHFKGPGDAWEAWLRKARSGGVREIFESFPVLARGLSGVTLNAVETLSELLSRLEKDRQALEETFGFLGELSGLQPGLSDRHYHGRQVALVHFESGKSLIYKAKSVDLDEAFQRMLRRLRTDPSIPLPASLGILRREGYGWVQFVEQEPFSDEAEVEEYFRRGGGLLALVYALEGRDFIMDNLIATRQGPIAIDAEAALQPLCLPAGAEKMERGSLLEQLLSGRDFSVLDTGMVPLWMPGGKGYYDMSGLGGQTGYVSALQQEVWQHTGTAAIRCVRLPVPVKPEKNQVELRGRIQSAADYAEHVQEGFREIYHRIIIERRAVLAELESLADCQVRFLLRPTNTYGQMLKRMLSADALTSGVRAGIEAEILCRPFISGSEPPPIAYFLREEIAALQRWDIPCFHLAADKAEHPCYLASPLVMARDRIDRMCEEDLEKQCRVLRASLTLRPRPDLGGVATPHDPFPDLTLTRRQEDPDWRMPNAPLLTQAEAIADLLIKLPSGVTGPKGVLLYEGKPGGAIFFAALGKLSGNPEYTERASKLTESWLLDAYSADFRRSRDTLPVGAADGLASLPYSCWVLSRLLNRTDLMDRAAEMSGWISRVRLAQDAQLDIFSGAAGACMVFSALSGATDGDAIFQDRAGWAMERLLETRVLSPGGGTSWQAGGEHYLGYGHGAAGIGAALIRAARGMENEDALRVGLAALCTAVKSGAADTGWPHLLKGGVPVFQRMESLCHGTPGLAMAVTDAMRHGAWEDRETLKEIWIRLENLDPHPIDTLCCGNAGRLEALLGLGARHTTLADLLRVMIKRREPLGLFRTDFKRSDIYGCPPGFFRGLSGIGYQLLRLSAPRELPSVAGFL